MEDDGGDRSSFVIALIENRAKEVACLILCFSLRRFHLYVILRGPTRMHDNLTAYSPRVVVLFDYLICNQFQNIGYSLSI